MMSVQSTVRFTPRGCRRDVVLTFRVSGEERAWLIRESKEDLCSVSDYVRGLIRAGMKGGKRCRGRAKISEEV